MHCQVTFQPIGKRTTVPAGSTLLEAGRQAGLVLSANCGGIGVCRRCRVVVNGDGLEAPLPKEVATLTQIELDSGMRLACRTRVLSDLVVDVPPGMLVGAQRLQIDSAGAELVIDPMIRRVDVQVAPPAQGEARSDWKRICDSLRESHVSADPFAPPRVAAQASRLARQQDWTMGVFLRETAIIGFTERGRSPLGLAVDLGCTKIAGYLVDLANGTTRVAHGVANPQISYGEDLITRLVHAVRTPSGARNLSICVRQALDGLLQDLLRRAHAPGSDVTDLCIVGNTAMIHLLLELPVEQLLHSPFIAATDRPADIAAADLGLEVAPGARIHILPSVGGFVGADHVAMMLACGAGARGCRKTVLAIDVGTNTEIALWRGRERVLLTTSVPSGPALEGGHIRDGMRATPGAIEKATLDGDALRLSTIDAAPPIGICGSGVIDLVACLHRSGRVNNRGHLQVSAPGIRTGAHGRELVLVPADQSGSGQAIVFAQDDVSEVQLAKAAISAGILSLLERAETSPDEVDQVIVAGAFGTHLDLESAVTIGLLPRFENASYAQVGNAAGMGAKMCLVSRAARIEARRLAELAQHVDLKAQPNFNRLLARSTRFPALDD